MINNTPDTPPRQGTSSALAKRCFLLSLTASIIFSLTSCSKMTAGENMPRPVKEQTLKLTSTNISGLPQGMMALTYDDGPGSATLAIARYLHEQHISATFFVCGRNGSGGYLNYPILDSLVYYGQRIGNHSFSHPDFTNMSCSEVDLEITKNQKYIDLAIKNNLCYFRPPWNFWMKDSYNCLLADQSIDYLRGPVAWNLESKDYLYSADPDPEAIITKKFLNDSSVAEGFNKLKGGILLIDDFNDAYAVRDFGLRETKLIVQRLKARGYIFTPPTLEFSPVSIKLSKNDDFSDREGWASDIGNYGTIRLADVNGDGKADLVGRSLAGIYVALSNGVGFDQVKLWNNEFTDSHGWKPAKYSTTLQCADVDGDGKADIIIRGPAGMEVALSTGYSFKHSVTWTTQFSDSPAQPWSKDSAYYGTIRTVDVNGDKKADIIARGPDGIYVALSNGSKFLPAVLWTKEFSDKGAWRSAKYWKTIQVADVDGDGKADLIGRGPAGIQVALSTGSGFLPSTTWTTAFSDASGCGRNIAYYGGIRYGDVNGDGMADLVARCEDGIHVALSNGHGFINNTVWSNADFTDKKGWKPEYYSTTILCGDINGDKRADVIGRADRGITGAFSP